MAWWDMIWMNVLWQDFIQFNVRVNKDNDETDALKETDGIR